MTQQPNKPIYLVYMPPMEGLPYLAVVLRPDGSTVATAFPTEREAAAFNKQMIRDDLVGTIH